MNKQIINAIRLILRWFVAVAITPILLLVSPLFLLLDFLHDDDCTKEMFIGWYGWLSLKEDV